MSRTLSVAEYIWLDGAKPTQKVRSKARVVQIKDAPTLEQFPDWGFDGSSTYQAEGQDSDLILKPVTFVPDPTRGDNNYLVLCEVFTPDNQPHESNLRAMLRSVLKEAGPDLEPYVGFEQEYTLFSEGKILGFPDNGFPSPQGPFYCGVGPEDIHGRELVEAHTQACLEAGLLIYGINAEVMPGQWEFQVGYRGFEGDDNDALTTCDHKIFALWLLYRLGEEFGIQASLSNKPMKGDWNGAGCHTNFSTKAMREPSTGRATIDEAIDRLSKKHPEHIAVYGAGLSDRLTGLHETCDITEFKAGVANRGASIRIPRPVEQKGYGYIEDRRPGANSNPYLVVARLITTICDLDDKKIPTGQNELNEFLMLKDLKEKTKSPA